MLVLVALARRHRVDEAVLLAGSEYTVADLSDPRLLPTRDDEAVLVRNLVRALGGALGPAVEAGQDFHVGAVSAWGQAMRTSPTLGHALALSLDLTAAADTLVHLRAVPDDEVTHLVFDADHLPADTRPFQSVWMMVTTAIINRELLGRPTLVDSVRVRCAKPPDAPLVDDFWGVEVQWDARVTSIGVPVAVLDAPLPSADPRGGAAGVRAAVHRRRRRPRPGRAGPRPGEPPGRHRRDPGPVRTHPPPPTRRGGHRAPRTGRRGPAGPGRGPAHRGPAPVGGGRPARLHRHLGVQPRLQALDRRDPHGLAALPAPVVRSRGPRGLGCRA